MIAVTKVTIGSFLILQLGGCGEPIEVNNKLTNQYSHQDKYPQSKMGIESIEGKLISSLYITGQSVAPGLIELDNGCYIVAEATKYGKYSASVKPSSVSCEEGYKVDVMGKIGISYLDHRISKNRDHSIELQVYDQSLIDWLSVH